MRDVSTGARVKASADLGFGSVPVGTLGTVERLFFERDGKLRIVVNWDNGVKNVWTELSLSRWIDAAD